MRSTRLKAPRRVVINGKSFWRVEAPAPGGGRIRKTFLDRDDARIFHERAKVGLQRFGAAAMALDEKARADALRALEILAPHGASILDAARDYAARAEARKGGKPLAEAVEKFLEDKKDTGLSERYLNDLRLRLNRLTATLPKATTTTVDTPAINGFLRDLKLQAATANTFRRDINTFFSWCVDANLCQTNPAAKATIFKAVPEPITAITAQQFATLLDKAEDCIRPAIVLGGFCALRQAEIERLDWRAIDLKERVVTLDAGTAKTNSRRAVMMPLAAVAWLAPTKKESGPVLTQDGETRAAWDLARLATGFGPFKTSLLRVRKAIKAMSEEEQKALVPWPDNALRHSAISARLALSAADAAVAFEIAPEATLSVTDIAAVAYQAGNSPQVIRAHYLRLLKPEAARKWFAIKPTADATSVAPKKERPCRKKPSRKSPPRRTPPKRKSP